MAQNIRIIVNGVISPILAALRTAHTSTTTAVADLVDALNNKANIVHTHKTSDITDLTNMTRAATETVVQPDGVSIILPWVINNDIAACDVLVDGSPVYISDMTSSGNTIVLSNSVTGGVRAQVVFYSDIIVNTDEQIDTQFISNFVIFNSLPASSFDTGGAGLTTGDTIFDSLSASSWTSGGAGLTSGDYIIQSLSASDYV
jgi:hypothetical protein